MGVTKTLPGYRVVRTFRGDTLQRVAERETGDPAQWYDLIELNGLRPPYLTDDPAQVSAGVLLAGGSLRVPANEVVLVQGETDDDLFGTDCRLSKGEMPVENGDFALIAGVDNLVQALRHLVVTEPGELVFHPRYGCGVRPYLGAANTRANGLVAGSLVKRAVHADPRIHSVREATVEMSGDLLRIEVRAEAIHSVPLSMGVTV